MVPKFTAPETKFIRTAEGVLVVFFNVVVVVAVLVTHIISGVHGLSTMESMKWLGVINSIAVLARTGLKGIMSFSGVTGIQPEAPALLQTISDDFTKYEPEVEQVIPEVEAVVAQAETALAGPPESATTPDPSPPSAPPST